MKTSRPTDAQIAACAYQLYLESGCHHGHDTDHWLQTESELLHLPVRKLAKLPPRPVAGRKSLIGLVHTLLLQPQPRTST